MQTRRHESGDYDEGLIGGEWVRLSAEVKYERGKPPRPPDAVPAQVEDAAVARRALAHWPSDLVDPASGLPITPTDYENAQRIVQTVVCATKEDRADDYVTAQKSGAAKDALAVMVLTPRSERKALGIPVTYGQFDAEWGFKGWARDTARSPAFNRDHIRDGRALEMGRDLADSVFGSLKRKLDADTDTSGHAVLAAKVAGLLADTAKDKFEGTAREGAREEATPGEIAGRWVSKLVGTSAWRAMLSYVKDREKLETLTEAMLVEAFSGGKPQPEARQIEGPATEVVAPSEGRFERQHFRPGQVEDAVVVE